MIGQRVLAARLREPADELVLGLVRPQIDVQLGIAVERDDVAQMRRKRIDRAAFDAVARDDGLAALDAIAGLEQRVLQRLTGEALAENIAPRNGESAVGRTQRRNRYALLSEDARPVTVGAKPRPACTAERQERRSRPHGLTLASRFERQRIAVPSQPMMAQAELDALPIEPREPGAQQRRSLHRFRKHPAARPDERFRA